MSKLASMYAAIVLTTCLATPSFAATPYPDGTISCTTASSIQFAPNYGVVEAGEDQYGRWIMQYMYWQYSSRVGWFRNTGDSTFEPDALFYAYDGIRPYGTKPAGYWSSDLPAPYQDTNTASDSPYEKVVTVGSADADKIVSGRLYYTFTRMMSGGGTGGKVKLLAQRGRLWLNCPSYRLTDCAYSCNQWDNHIKVFPFNDTRKVPGCYRYWYDYIYNSQYYTARERC